MNPCSSSPSLPPSLPASLSILLVVAASPVTACGDAAGAGEADAGTAACVGGSSLAAVEPSFFDDAGLAAPITEERCTLSSGVVTTCLKIQLRGAPTDHEVGPFCPRRITDTADSAGIWLQDGEVYDVDGPFVKNLATFYGDAAWQLYDPATGAVKVTDTRASCEAAARPDVDPQYNNYCVECSLDYVSGGVTTTLLIPEVPVARATPAEIGMAAAVGAAFNGVAFDPPAPVQAILAAHTIAAFDDCGGHVNLVAGYHYHAATGCSRHIPACDDHAALLGYALDGYGLYAQLDAARAEPDDLDACRGHTDAVRGYHYHVGAPGENLFVGCFHGETVDTGGGGGPPICAAGQTSMCCGDGTCDGPETSANCAADCP